MNYGFKRIKDQIKPRDEVVNDTIERSKHIKRDHPQSVVLTRITTFVSIICVFVICCFAIPYIANFGGTPIPLDSTNNNETNPPIELPEGAMSFNEGVTISAELNKLMNTADKSELLSVKIKVVDLTEAYEDDYKSIQYDGNTYEEWGEEYEIVKARMIEIDGMLKDGPNAELEAEYNACVEKSEEINIILSDIQKKQKAESIQKEIEFFKTLGIETEYKGGYLVADLNVEQIKSIGGGMCDYYIDVAQKTEEMEEMH